MDKLTLVERLNKTAEILELQADFARRTAETYAPERMRWDADERDDRLVGLIRYQLEQEHQAKNLDKDAEEAREAAATIAALEARVGELERALEQIKADCQCAIDLYERNGPGFTSPAGDEYEEASYVQDKMQELILVVEATTPQGPSDG